MAVLAGHEPFKSSGHTPKARERQEQGGRRHYGEQWQRRDPLQLLTLYFSTQTSVLFTAQQW